jgi:hypothetical protein
MKLLNRRKYAAGTLSTRIESWRSLRENLGKWENFDEVITWIENGFNVKNVSKRFGVATKIKLKIAVDPFHVCLKTIK